ncbi:MAG: DUF3298 domain-containing protein [Actinomycetota bacterium]|nr:DUF3298 domain-containing protein [Actinomycetota bacterium]
MKVAKLGKSRIFAILTPLVLAGCGATATTATTTTAPSLSSTTLIPPTVTAAPGTTAAPTTTVVEVTPNVSASVFAKSSTSPNYTINISYPVVSGLVSSVDESNINSQIANAVNSWAESFAQNLSLGSSNVQTSTTSTLNGAFKVILADSKIFSVQFVLQTATASNAAATTTISTLNFNLSTGTLLSLPGLFKSGSDFLSILSRDSRSQLQQQLSAQGVAASSLSQSGTSPLPSNFAAFNITSNSIMIGFSQGQAVPSSIGAVTVNVPLADLAGAIDPNGPLANP